MNNLRSRTILACLGLLLALIWVMPNVINLQDKWWPSSKRLNYGLDIQGGLHLVMGVDVAGVVNDTATRLSGVLKAELEKEGISITVVKVINSEVGELEISFPSPELKDKVVKYIDDRYATMLQVLNSTDSAVSVRYFDAYLTDYKSKIIHQAIETIRNRIDEFGVAEPSISQQGEGRILVQLPGMADAERAKALIKTAAKLDFMMVEDEKTPADLPQLIAEAEKAGNYSLGPLKYTEYVTRLNQDLKGKLPEKTMVLFEKSENAQTMEVGRVPFLLRTDTDLGGDALDDAFVSFNQYGAPEVALRFNSLGANKFKNITGSNIGKRMAVVLDKVVKTAPVLQTQISDGHAVITLGSSRDRDKSMEEAKMISTSLRAGALPATLEQLEERRVGPTLGADSIHKAQMASWIGALLILVFMVARYRAMGVISDISLGINILSVVALLTSFGATLTLPGIAGIALTVGFAVDANVLINERMREELHKGSSFALAVKEGYARAMSAILDANITTAATAVVLLYFGTGPVKGFAVTLLIGIATTLFANVFVSKLIVDLTIHRFGVKKLSV
ncbi:MAG: protein translocase subunit SecD [Bdellovibrio sp. CG10_big_fil_rev_8_21_14_0_10_47_8]|nr:MAG: protein translocase subunit SecD [Bdellovibrio sp. CG10_big_fil_rev_8_21_14_0_10_47_8]